MVTAVSPTLPAIAPQSPGSTTSAVLLQPGTVVNATVLKAAENLVQIAIADLAIDVLSEVPLSAGQNLQLAVSQAEDGTIRLAVVGEGTALGAPALSDGPATVPPNDPLTPLERIAVSVATENAATHQQSLAPLFANLNAVAALDGLPPAVGQAVAQVLAQQTGLDQNLTGDDVQNAFAKSGLFLEASLAAGVLPSDGGLPDLKAALIVLRQTLTAAIKTGEGETALAASTPPAVAAAPGKEASAQTAQSTTSPTSAPAQSPDIGNHEITLAQARLPLAGEVVAGNAGKFLLVEAPLGAEPRLASPNTAFDSAASNLLQETLQEILRAAGNALAVAVALTDSREAEAAVRTNTPPPPFRGAAPAAQPIAAPSIAPNATLATAVRHLLSGTDAAIARQTLLQVASLPDRVEAPGSRVDPSTPRWHFEVPFATPQGTAVAQFEISRDRGGNDVETAKRIWRARFSLNLEPAGPVHALVALSGERTSVRMWAERPQTAAQLRAGAAELNQALTNAELVPGDIVIREGTPPSTSPAKAGHFLNRAL
jgi:hypothetical protein